MNAKAKAFNSLIISSCNKLQIETAMLYSEMSLINTGLYIHGGIGYGKTAILKATFEAFSIKNPKLSSIFLDALELIKMIRDCKSEEELERFIDQFSSKYRFIAIDSFAYFCGDEYLQEVILKILNPLYGTPPMVALTSQRHFDNHVLIPELQDYFDKSIVVSLLPFDQEFKVAAISNKVREYSMAISRETIRMLSLVIGDSGHEIEDCIRKICMQ